MTLKAFKTNNNKNIDGNDSKTNKTVVNLSKNLPCIPNIRAIKKPIFLTPDAKKAFNYLRQAFIKVSNFCFDLESHIWIKIDISDNVIGKILS